MAEGRQLRANPGPASAPTLVARQVTHTETESFSGILPRPDHLEKYEVLLPGIAERLVRQTELEAEHRRGMETKAVEAGIQEMRLRNDNIRFGQYSALGLSAGAILLSGYAVYAGSFVAASTIAVSVVGALATAFIIGGKRARDTDDEPRK